MYKIRFNIFESNSSSTHTLIISTKEDYKKWKSGKLYLDAWHGELLTEEEVLKQLRNNFQRYGRDINVENLKTEAPDLFHEECRENGIYDLDDYYENDYLEEYEREYTSPSGDELVIWGKYGNDY